MKTVEEGFHYLPSDDDRQSPSGYLRLVKLDLINNFLKIAHMIYFNTH